jgi:hypothetical protein
MMMYQLVCGHVNYALGKTHQIICHTQWWHHKCHNIGCDDDEEEKVDSDDMEYTEDAIDNMNLEFSGD